MEAYDPARDGFDNARLMWVGAKLGRLLSSEVADLTYGAHNPNFCSADASERALEMFAVLRREIAHYERQARAASAIPSREGQDRETGLGAEQG